MNWRKLLWRAQPDPRVEPLARFDSANPSEGDALVIEQLVKVGADLTQAREVLHYLYAPTAEAARRAALGLQSKGFDVDQKEVPNDGAEASFPFLVVARNHMMVNTDSIAATRRRFESLAKETHGDYDGWEAAGKP